jgi:hypothetical protein
MHGNPSEAIVKFLKNVKGLARNITKSDRGDNDNVAERIRTFWWRKLRNVVGQSGNSVEEITGSRGGDPEPPVNDLRIAGREMRYERLGSLQRGSRYSVEGIMSPGSGQRAGEDFRGRSRHTARTRADI